LGRFYANFATNGLYPAITSIYVAFGNGAFDHWPAQTLDDVMVGGYAKQKKSN
jgi:hypothetical protein